LRVDDEQFLNLTTDEENEFLQAVRDLLVNNAPDAIILQDYNKGVLSPDIIKRVIQLARDSGIPVTVDPKKDNFNLYSGVAVFKPNLRELSDQFVVEVTHHKESLDKAVTALRKEMDIELCCVTLSEHGIYISTETESAIYPTRPRDVVDVCGAGDAVISVLTLAYIQGLSPQRAAELANHAGGAVCGIVGVAPVSIVMLGKELGVETFL
jgi:rfaE bifunctional protein kinase chain/domain